MRGPGERVLAYTYDELCKRMVAKESLVRVQLEGTEERRRNLETLERVKSFVVLRILKCYRLQFVVVERVGVVLQVPIFVLLYELPISSALFSMSS